MMVTHSEAGELHVRPMALLGEPNKFEGSLWFFAASDSGKLREMSADSTSLVFQSDRDSAYLYLTGQAEQVQDRAKMKELYTPIVRTWFPDGLDDPRLTLIRFDAAKGHFWDSPGGMIQVLAAFTKSVVTGNPGGAGEMGEVKL